MSEHRFHLPRYAKQLLGPEHYKSLRGGRMSSKTWTTAHLLVIRAAQEKVIIACCKEFQTSISVSAKPAIEAAIHRLGLTNRFEIYRSAIRGHNGSLFFFKGLERNREEIKGWEGVDIVWVEEAQRLSRESAEILIPTVARNRGYQLWFTWNPKYRTDWVWDRFVLKPRPGDISLLVNWDSNRWLPPDAHSERLAFQKTEPERYPHVWEGEPDDEGGERKVLPFGLLRGCVEAWDRGLAPSGGIVEIGLDVADEGSAYSALARRRGPVLEHVEQWRGRIGVTARRAHAHAHEHGAARVHYDVGGLGAGVKSYFGELAAERRYAVRPELFGGAVKGEENQYSFRVTNGEFFAKRNAQLGWALRLRAQNTERLLAGEDVNPQECLFIRSDIPQLERLLAQMTQPAWRENETTGKVEVFKSGEAGRRDVKDVPSPDKYDACVLAFAHTSSRGLRAHRERGKYNT